MRLQLSPRAYHRITRFALFALIFIIVTGGLVRLTGSGLGCSDWPTCEENQFVAALDQPHAVVEFVNRLITGLVSLAVILAVLGSLVRVPRRRDLTLWSIGLVVGVLAQIVLGAIVVKSELTVSSVGAHFLVSIVLAWNAVVLHHRAGEPGTDRVALVPEGVIRLSRLVVAWGVVVLVAGVLVTGSGPHGGDEHVERLPLAVGTVARIHGITVIVFLVLATLLLRRITATGAPAVVHDRAKQLVGAIVFQAIVGYTQYFTGVPVVLVALHLLGAPLVFVATVALHLNLWTRPAVGPDDPEAAPGRPDVAPATSTPTA